MSTRPIQNALYAVAAAMGLVLGIVLTSATVHAGPPDITDIQAPLIQGPGTSTVMPAPSQRD